MKTKYLAIISFIAISSLAHSQMRTADRKSYVITLQYNLTLDQLDECLESICQFSGTKENIECEVVSERFHIVAANLSNQAVNKVKTLRCVKSLRFERADIVAKPRSGRSN